MQIGSRFRCYPTRVQAKTLWQWIGCQRFIYNAKVGEDRYFRTFARKSLSLAGQFAPIDQQYSHFKTELTPWLSEVPSQVLRNGAVKWMQAYSRYFQKLGGRPAIQSKHGKQSVWLTSELFEFVPGYCDIKSRALHYALRIGTRKHPLGILHFKAHKAYQLPKSLSISVHAGRWYLSFSAEDDLPEPDEKDTIAWLRQHTAEELSAMTVGCDRGVAKQIAASNGREFGFSAIQKKRIAKQDKHKRRWQKIMARRVRASNNYHKARRRAARYERYAIDVRRDLAHQTSHALVSDIETRLIVFEALKLRNMTASASGTTDAPGKNVAQKAGLNRAMLCSALGMIKTYAQYKARRRAKLCLEVPPHFSSQECAVCGHTHSGNRISQSEFVCQRCKNRDNADFNASKVLAARGIALLLSDAFKLKDKKRCAIKRNKVGVECSEPAALPPTLVETGVSRPDPSVWAQQSVKQETLTTSLRL